MKRVSQTASSKKSKKQSDKPKGFQVLLSRGQIEEQEQLQAAWEVAFVDSFKQLPMAYVIWKEAEVQEWLRKRCESEFDWIPAMDQQNIELGYGPVFEMTEEERQNLINDVLVEALDIFRDRFEVLAKVAWVQSLQETQYLFTSLMIKARFGEKAARALLPTKKILEEGLLGFYQIGMRADIAADGRRGQTARRANLQLLQNTYEDIVEAWKEASTMCRSALSSSSENRKANWQEEISRAFPELPVDLIVRLQPTHFWPADIAQAASGKKHGTSDPLDIALEHAARLCGAKPYAYMLSYLRKLCKKRKASE